ncbi:type VI protein secretion system component VasK [Pedobacter africanus]|uniref:Type VI protein secretion system component VasK n=1 Tax=Pedobacter africanus TaxID=151894 RepID=A0ACC6KWN9_9SPHI|nr:hypothetical protein [Pedobacter africanus]MDR6783759.1 type VI protein secretion system component VasK [Pedobacter africanus]
MKELLLSRAGYALNLLNEIKKEHRLMLVLLLLWGLVTHWFSSPEFSAGINQSVPIMIVIALITFLILLYLCYWLLERFWQRTGLPGIEIMVLQFKKLNGWVQLGFYWLCFALLILAGLGCLVVVL